MTASEQRIRDLALKWTNGSMTPEEREEFLRWYNNADDGKPLPIPEYFAKDELSHGLRILHTVYEEAGIAHSTSEKQGGMLVHLRRNWMRYAAALVVVAGLGILSVNLFKNDTAPQIVQVDPQKHHDIKAPSTVNATILLDDGSSIILDSLANGVVSTKSGAKFTKVQDGQIVYQPENQKQVFSTLVNPRGSRVIQVTLADGTRVWLNSESSIRYPNVFTGNERTVEVTGQTYFEVAKNESMPFIVRKGSAQVRVLGTHFDINAYDDEDQLAITLLEGAVRVSNGTFASQQLKPAEQSLIDRNGKLTRVANVDVDKVVAWKNGKFDFGSKTDINTILRQITRWYNLELEFKSDAKKYYGGSISRDVNLSEVLKVLETAGDIKFEIQGNKLRVLQ